MLMLAAAVQAGEAHKQLRMEDIGITLAVIAACCALILLAGFGYFTFNDDDSDGDTGGADG